jgi:hypothetical protein
MGISYDHFGDFNLVLVACALVLFILGIASFWATPPTPQPMTEELFDL